MKATLRQRQRSAGNRRRRAEGRLDVFSSIPGQRVYVRRISFKGNTKTRDEVLRREMRQMESGWISTAAVERSRIRLNRLGFFESVDVETPAVPGASDQVDVDFTVTERPSGNLLLGAGYSDSQGAVFDISVTEENVLEPATASEHRSTPATSAETFLSPGSIPTGLSTVSAVALDVYNRRTDASEANLADYDLDQIGAEVTFGIPVSELTRVNVGLQGRADRLPRQPVCVR